MKKNYNLILAALALLFAGCASEELSEVVNPEGKFANSELIQFSTLRQNSTRADLDGEEAALKLNKQFYVYGEKSSAVTPVFPSFLVKWQGTSTTTDTNTKGWEYVLTEKPEQTVRYWDYAADNPSGNFLPRHELLDLATWCRKRSTKLIVDESFVDFSHDYRNNSLLCDNVLEANPNLIVMKSISKSYGVPGLRLGILASADMELVASLKTDVSIWNINSFAEFFMQIYTVAHLSFK